MIGIINYMQFCRLCLVKEKVNVPIFDNTNDDKQLFLKITQCLPVKVSPDDKLPKSICESCLHKVDSIYQFQNMTVNSEKQLVQWLKEVGIDISDKSLNQTRLECTNNQHEQHSIHTDIVLKQEQDLETLNVNAQTYQNQSYQDYNLSFSQMAGDTGSAFSQSGVSQPTSDADESDRGTQPDNSEDDAMTGNRIAKEEVESEEDYDEAGDALEPTAFVGVPSTSVSDEERPGPSGLSKPGPNPGLNLYEDFKMIYKEMEPICTLVELAEPKWKITLPKLNSTTDKMESDSDDNMSLLKIKEKLEKNKVTMTKNKDKKAPIKKTIPNVGYKNPFIYDHLIKNNKPSKKERKPKIQNKWKCLICRENLESKQKLIEHYAAHKENKIKMENLPENEVYQCHVCLKEFMSEKRYEKHIEIHNDTRYNCEFCEKTFKRPYDYAVHIRFHTKDDKLKCYMCDYTTTLNSSLKMHIKQHESEYKYKCETCGKGFFYQTWFEEHKNFHTGAKPFSCEICNKSFTYSRYLIAHKRSKHPEPFKDVHVINECQFCKKRFAHKKSLLLHERGHTGENTVLCDICGKQLSSNDHLKLHRRIHTGYKPFLCSVCNKGFAKKCNLTLHERVHSGEKPYVCDVCGKCFSQRSTLVIHTRYHTGVRPYVCQLCNKGFVAKGVLSIHLKSCSGHSVMEN